jgi:hypothetical protein
MRVAPLLALCGTLVVLSAGSAQTAKPVKLDEAAVRAKLLAGPAIEAKVSKVDEDTGRVTLVYVHENKTLKPDGQKKLAEAQAKFNIIANRQTTSLEEFNKAKAEFQEAEKGAYNIEEVVVKLDFKGDDKLVVRTYLVPAGPDGKPKKLTEAEKKKLKGDPKLPGYQATLKDVAPDQNIRVSLDKAKLKAIGKSDDAPVYPITMILIEPPPPEEKK